MMRWTPIFVGGAITGAAIMFVALIVYILKLPDEEFP